MSRPLRMGAAAAVVSGSILLSRILGLLRDVLLASMFGVTAEGDLYWQAFTIPDLLNYLLAGAFLTITLIPILSSKIENEGQNAANQAFTSVFRFVAIVILVLTALIWLGAEFLVALLFPEASDPDRLVSLTRLAVPAQVFLVLGALLIAVQYTYKRFLYPALAPLIYNLGIIGGGLIGAAVAEPSIEAFIWGAVAGSAIGNFGLQWFGARRTGIRFTQVPPGRSAVKEYLLLALPLMVGLSIAVLDEQFVRFFGQVEEGATAALSFARRLNMVPVGVIAQAAGVAAFPFLASLWARGDNKGLIATTGRAARNTVFIALAASAVLIVLARPLVRVLYQYGEFTAADSDLVAGLLMIYALSVPAWGLQAILSRHFYAKRRMWTPVLIGTAGTALAIPVWLSLYDRLGVQGYAWASVIVMSAYAVALLVAWGTDSGWRPVRRLIPSLLRGLGSAIVGVAAGLLVTNGLVPDEIVSTWTALWSGALVGAAAIAGFGLTAYLLRSPELDELRRSRTS